MSTSETAVPAHQGHLHPAAEDAATRYAAGYIAEARRALEGGLAVAPDERRLWLMLLDLHRLDGQWGEYEALLNRYTGLFGQLPPYERERLEQEARLPEALRPGGPACWSLGGALDTTAVGALARLREAASRHTVVHLDFSRLSTIEATGCRLLADTLQQLVSGGNGLVITGASQLERLLVRATEADPLKRPFWELLLVLQRCVGDQTAFERTALEYALAANLAVPVWEPLIMPQPAAPDPSERRGEPRYVNRETLALKGLMSGTDDPQLVAVADFAATQQYVNLACGQLERVDLVCAAQFASAIASMVAEGRVVRLIRPNQLVAALFEVLNLGANATIVAPKA
ncbi:MAG: hypothetical protein KIT73_18165 [Burkholderiales bacterium]|nr:hypothetical protein [Burkholderiales bacterium]